MIKKAILKVNSYLSSEDLIKKSLQVLFIRVLGVCLFLGISLFITNKFPVKVVGEYDFTRSILNLLGSICLMGMQESIIYYSGSLIAENNLQNIRNVYLKMLVIMFVIAIGLFLIIFITPPSIINDFFNTKDIYILILKTIAIIYFYGLTMLNIEILRAIKRIKISEYFRNIFRYIFFFFAIIAFSLAGIQDGVAEVFLINLVFLGVISTPIIFYFLSKMPKRPDSNLISYKKIIIRSLPMSISVISFLLMQSVDIILLKKYSDFDKIAYYAVSVKITTIIALVLSSVNAVYAPMIAELYTGNKIEKLKVKIKIATRMIFIITIPMIIFLALFTKQILNLFGDQYMEGSLALRILLIGQVVNTLCGSVGVYMNMTGKQNYYQKILILAFATNLVLNLILIPKFNIVGAAVATSISLALWNLLGAYYLFKKDKIKTFLN